MSDYRTEDRIPEDNDGPADEIELGSVIEGEVARLVRHPREEVARLKEVAADGEHGTAPYIEIGLVARWVIPFVLTLVGIVLLVYFKA
jgi:hypothetical protein